MSLGWLDHFEVTRFLGSGVMSNVYLAHDAHLDCDVALKVLREDHAGDAAHRTRLLAEARALAKLDHPNIVGILDCGESAPRPPDFLWQDQPGPHPAQVVYLAMRYVEGRDLTEAIAARRLPLERAIDWAKQIARGLEAAHAQGVVHRDLKPANVRVTPEGVLKIVDFGLASSRRSMVDSLTQTGSLTREVILGTIGYSAPEQGEAVDHVDPRCDLFSLGAILYEMVTGHRPFEGDTALDVLREIATHEPPPLQRFAHGVPDELERIVGKLLQKDPKRRYQSAREVVTDLEAMHLTRRRIIPPRRAGPVVFGVALAAVLLTWILWPRLPETVAMVEFENQTGDPGMDRLASGLGLDLVTSLVQTCRIVVVTSTLRDAEGRAIREPAAIARAYGARKVLLGTLHVEGGPGPGSVLSLHVRIVRTSDNSILWARAWDAPARDMERLIGQMSDAVVAYWPRIPGAEASPLGTPAGRPGEAYEAYLRGLALFWDTDPVLRDSSIVEFDRALALDREFGRALAYRARAKLAAYLIDRDTTRLAPAELDARKAVTLPASEIEGRIALARILRERGRTAESIGELRAVLLLNDRNPEAYTELANGCAKLGDMDRAREYHRRSVEIQRTNPRAWRAYGRFLLQTVSDLPEAEKAFRMELKLTPDANRGYETVAAVLVKQCRYAEALATYAKRPKPGAKSTDLAGNRGTAYFFNGDYALALQDFLDAVSASPEDGNWRINLGDVYAHLGRAGDALGEYRTAQRCFERDMAADPEDIVSRTRYAKSLAKAGDDARARTQADTCIAANPWRNAEAVHDLAMALTICGERERALAALDTLVNGRKFSKCLLRVEDEFEGIRSDPRFAALFGDPKR